MKAALATGGASARRQAWAASAPSASAIGPVAVSSPPSRPALTAGTGQGPASACWLMPSVFGRSTHSTASTYTARYQACTSRGSTPSSSA